jgi:hypothetical protein
MNDDEMPLLLGAGVILFLLWQSGQNKLLLQEQQLAAQNAQAQATIQAQTAIATDPWITVPGAIDAGIAGAGSILSGFNNLFSANPSSN